MAITNIDDPGYNDLYCEIDGNLLIRAFQWFKLRTIFPILKMAGKKERTADIGCANGKFLMRLKMLGYENVCGIDLERTLYPSIADSVEFHKGSITEMTAADVGTFENVIVQNMLHHLPPGEITRAVSNIADMTRKGGKVFVYEPNMSSLIGRFFYNGFLRLFPALYRATMLEKEDQLVFCAAWPEQVVQTLRNQGVRIVRYSNYSFYKVLVGIKE